MSLIFEALGGQSLSPVHLLIFPHAGGQPAAYRPLAEQLGQRLQVCAMLYPGRGRRMFEPLPTAIADLAEEALMAVPRDQSLVLLGHSMGGFVAHALARLLCEQGRPPVRLLLSSVRAPHQVAHRPLAGCSDEDFVSALLELGGIAPQLLCDAEARELFLPILRADFALAETYHARPAKPLTCAVSLFHGQDDEHVPLADLQRWRDWTAIDELRQQPGGHFHLLQQPGAFAASLASFLPGLARPLSA
ncbi:thioesterase II family protein [Pseudomonas gingeri]|uniref:Thioesterase n=1 Tax=Pseudomonas gingeri TaxID=117681 RepID=A0A7Y7YAE2_9PSED|nr:alpha/beta fold hydrolase [Pseudomonas gingeri]NWB26742.1 thioesterase [Pseudomonas gingeri]NWC32708.1 thioesterase [Pseudomonas gingeri]NWD07120.1 thioesterase [Pseudomonas gingeri]NWE31719.1 thioesterase [Pseudomonas gingeri]NWE57264.1 thioesterase [Pseudomonas gingeri]